MEHSKIINLQDYWKGRDYKFQSQLTDDIITNAVELLRRVNALLQEMHIVNVSVSSGWRPKEVNDAYNGAKNSYHIVGQAIDIADHDRRISKEIEERSWLLKKHDLWMEDPRFTPTWVHLDTGMRPERDVRIFKPR
jgi:sulfatase maturation enzyme AslB (radical SAM superfamily)